jgi:TPR repeat protein
LEEAEKWYQLAAEQGDEKAKFNLDLVLKSKSSKSNDNK